MDLSKLCIDTSSNEDSESLNYFQYADRPDDSNQNVNTLPSASNINNQPQISQECPTNPLKSCSSSPLKHVIEQCTFLQKDILKYQSQPFTEELRSIMLNQVYDTTSGILDSLKYLQGSQESEGMCDTPMISDQYKTINEYGMIRQARSLSDTEGPKYRRRSKRSMVGQYCHSCKTTETPEWRRGPDGARTLCNACGLHYSKLLRKGSLTVQTHNYLIESPSTYQRMARRSQLPESTTSRNRKKPYLPPINDAVIYNTNEPSTKNDNIKNWKL
ncbi:GATA-domain-containing protein [Backusella circina FSU 941]|nr:GATA-domain-containing protein [Backusella circina FSU 941]